MYKGLKGCRYIWRLERLVCTMHGRDKIDCMKNTQVEMIGYSTTVHIISKKPLNPYYRPSDSKGGVHS